MHCSNIELIDNEVTSDFLKLDKSNDTKEEQFLNILTITVTRDTSKFDKFIDFNDQHP